MRNPRAATIAHQQDGLITRQQALSAGASPDAIRHALGTGGRWQIVAAGIYATFDGPLAHIHRLRAALLRGGDGAMITGSAACRAAGLRYLVGDPEVVDVLGRFRRRPADAAFIRIHLTSRLPEPLWWVDTASPGAAEDHDRARPWWIPGDDLAPNTRRWTIPIAPIERATVDAVRYRSREVAAGHEVEHWRYNTVLRDARALLCEVVQRRRCTVADLLTELEAAPRAHSALARRATDDIVAGCRSAPECELRDIVRSSRVLPEPLWNEPLPGCSSIYPDACWPEARLVVEVNSWEWHRFGNAPEQTEQRHALYAALGWRVFPVSPYRLREDPAAVRRDLVAAYRAGLNG